MSLHWLLFVTVVLLLLQVQIYRWWGMRGIRYERYFNVSKCAEGDTVHLVEKVANRKWLPLPWLRLESLIHAHLKFHTQFDMDISSGERYQNHKSLFSLLPYMQITRRHRVVCTKRGCYRLNSAYMTCGDLFGWFRTAMPLTLDVELIVHPKPIPISEVPLPSHSWLGDITVRRWIVEDPFMTAGVREYRPDDPFHRIHWKSSARTGQLQVHRNDFTADRRLMVYLNFELDEKMWKQVTDPETIERGIRYAAAIVRYAISRGMDAGFGCNGRTIDEDPTRSLRIAPNSGKAHLEQVFDAMARLVIERTTPFDTFLQEDIERKVSNLDYVFITAYKSDKMKEHIRRLETNGNAVSVVLLHPDSGQGEVRAHA